MKILQKTMHLLFQSLYSFFQPVSFLSLVVSPPQPFSSRKKRQCCDGERPCSCAAARARSPTTLPPPPRETPLAKSAGGPFSRNSPRS